MTKRENEKGEQSFDELARGVADGTLSRTKALKAGGAAILGGVLSVFVLPSRDAEAARRRLLKTLWAVVNADGTLERGKGVIGTSKPGTGDYRVTFNRDVAGCAYSATLDEAAAGEISVFKKEVGGDETTPQQVAVATRNSASTLVDKPFHLIVHC